MGAMPRASAKPRSVFSLARVLAFSSLDSVVIVMPALLARSCWVISWSSRSFLSAWFMSVVYAEDMQNTSRSTSVKTAVR